MRRLSGAFILMVCVFSSPAFAQRYTLFPEFFSGNGWVCELFFTNQDFFPVSGIEIAFHDKNGNPVTIDSNLGTATSYVFDLSAGATQVIQVNPEAAYVEGYAVVMHPELSAIRATLVFRYVDGEGNVTVEAGVPQQEYGYHYSFPVEMDSSQGISTAVAIMNPEIIYSTEQIMIFNLIDSNGNIQATARLPLGPGEHFAGYLNEPNLFPGLDSTIGSISISSPFGAGVLALRQDKNAFGAISTDGGPVLGPFALDSLAIGEVEPNNNNGQAQFLADSSRISGIIGTAGDEDYFSFTGQAGDVISVICDAQLAGSRLDSVLEIRKSNGALIAENDQNGLAPALYPLNDSFIQVELPANDTYYLRVRDWGGSGGPNHYYTLHVNLRAGAPTSYFTIGGNISGLSGSVVLQNNAGDDLIITADGSFTFSAALANGTVYGVTVSIQPAGQTCAVTNGSGTIGSANVTNVQVTCTDNVTLSGKIAVPPGVVIDSDVNDTNESYTSNDTLSLAQTIPNPISVGGFANEAFTGSPLGRSYITGDENDYFRVQLKEGDTIVLAIGESDTISNDLDLWLFDSLGFLVDFSLGIGTYEKIIATADGDYFVNVNVWAGASNYILTIGADTTAGAGAAAEAGIISARHEFVPGQVIVRFKETDNTLALSQALTERAAAIGMELLAGAPDREMLMTFDDLNPQAAVYQALGVAQKLSLQGSNGDPELERKMNTIKVIKALRKRADILYAEPNYIAHHTGTHPNDDFYGLQWHYPQINLPEAWDHTTGDNSVIVAVIDTGVLMAHPDLNNRLTNTGYDFIQNPILSNDDDGIDANPGDPGDAIIGSSSFHGTHCAGTIAAETNNTDGVAGVTWNTQIMPIRVLGIGGGTSYDIRQGIRYAAGLSNDSGTIPPQTADIISLSLGGGGYSTLDQELINDVRDRGVIVIAAAGNDNSSDFLYPASYEGVVSVSAVNPNGTKASYSNYGTEIDIAAPGGDSGDVNGDGYPDVVWSTCGDDSSGYISYNYCPKAGTSMATPHVAGVVALMKALYPSLSPVELDFLISTGAITNDIGVSGRDDFYGYGLIDALKAVVAAQDAAGGGGVTAPSVDPTTINFGTAGTSNSVTVSKLGAGALSITNVSDDAPWLTVTASSVDSYGFGTYTLQANRNGLTYEGTYTATVTFTASSADSVSVKVTLQVVTMSVTWDAGYHYVLLVGINPDDTFDIVDQYNVDVLNGYYFYTFTDVPQGTYIIAAGSDRDNDRYINNPAESFGAYPTVDQLMRFDATGNLSGLDFQTNLRLSITSSAMSADPDTAQPRFRRLKLKSDKRVSRR